VCVTLTEKISEKNRRAREKRQQRQRIEKLTAFVRACVDEYLEMPRSLH
jgi:hypothetical protein